MTNVNNKSDVRQKRAEKGRSERRNQRIQAAIDATTQEISTLEHDCMEAEKTLMERENALMDVAERVIEIARVERDLAAQVVELEGKYSVLEEEWHAVIVNKCLQYKEMCGFKVNWTQGICGFHSFRLPLEGIEGVKAEILWPLMDLLAKLVNYMNSVLPEVAQTGLSFYYTIETIEGIARECIIIIKYGMPLLTVYKGDNLGKLCSLYNHAIKLWVKWLGHGFKEDSTFLMYNLALFFTYISDVLKK